MMRIEKRFLENSKGAIMIYCLLESDTRRGTMRLIEPWENIEINVLAEDRLKKKEQSFHCKKMIFIFCQNHWYILFIQKMRGHLRLF